MPQQYVDFTWVKSEADFPAVLSHYGIEAPRGKNQFKLSCPFHDEAEPSLSVNAGEKKFKCFGCDAQGSILDFVARMEDCDLRSAAIRLAEICGCGLAPPKGTAQSGGRRKAEERKKSHETTQTARAEEARASAAPYEPKRPAEAEPVTEERKATPVVTSLAERSPSSRPALASEGTNPPIRMELTLDPKHPYLARRGLTEETIATFGLGYCGRGLMRGRIAIPVHDTDGNLVAYAGRWPGDAGWPEGEGKYKLPKGFEKSAVLFNLHRVVPDGLEDVIVVEGYWSVFRLHQFGIENVVALMGRGFSAAQEKLLVEHFSQVILLLDGDAPGREATAAILPRLARKMYVRAPEVPEGKSPDDLEDHAIADLITTRR
jgi:DNA primase